MRTSQRVLLAALIAWTAFVWVNRITNAWSSETESTAGKVFSTGLAATFLLFVVAGLWVLVRAWKGPFTRAMANVLVAFAAWTTAVWAVRMVSISFGGHDLPFKVVHVLLGVVSIALAAAVARNAAARRPGSPAPAPVSTPPSGRR